MCSEHAHAQTPRRTTASPWTFFPDKNLFPPLLAHYQEPRVGVRKQVGSANLKLDIGSTLDFLEYSFAQDKKLRFGIDFFTYALTTTFEGARLQVDAVDGFFGGHILFHTFSKRRAFSLRLRILHLSAHFVDGHYDLDDNVWIDGRGPIPFTRNFGELVGAYEWITPGVSLMLYSGLNYAPHVAPEGIQRLSTIHGIQVHSDKLVSAVFGRPFNVFAADNFILSGASTYAGTNNLEFGMKFGEWSGNGLKLYVSYYSGLDIFSQYFDVRRSNWGVGFAFDFW